MAALRRVCDDSPRAIREINPNIPVRLVETIESVLQKKPEDRFQSAEEVTELLAKCLARLNESGQSSMNGIVIPHKKRHVKTLTTQASSRVRKWLVPAMIMLAVGVFFSVTEATGVTGLSSSVIRIVTGEGTLVIEVDDPGVQVAIDGEELSFWYGRANVYDTRSQFTLWMIRNVHGEATRWLGPKDLTGWNTLWGSNEESSLQSLVRFQGVDMPSRLHQSPQAITPADFRFRADSAGYQAGPDGKDLGADVDLVGPGEA